MVDDLGLLPARVVELAVEHRRLAGPAANGLPRDHLGLGIRRGQHGASIRTKVMGRPRRCVVIVEVPWDAIRTAISYRRRAAMFAEDRADCRVSATR